MKSPFPGMDPYLERSWGDVHQSVITYIRDWIQARLPPNLRARMQERVFVEWSESRRQIYYPDVHVVERPNVPPSAGIASAVAERSIVTDLSEGDPAFDEPLLIHFESEAVTEGYVEIIDVASGHRVITAIEVLSPTNKRPGEGHRLYLQKRDDQRAAGVNTVEIDLLRGGTRTMMVDAELIPPAYLKTYQVSVWRAVRPTCIALYAIPLARRLPVIAIPLRSTDPDVPLDLQAILDQTYRNGAYDDIDYRAEPVPPLPTAEARWVSALLIEQGKR